MEERPLQSNNTNWLIVKVFSIILISLSYLCPAWADNGSVPSRRLAILSSEEIQRCGLGDLLTVQMQELVGVELVERDMLQKVLNEMAVTKMLGADQIQNRRQVGSILKADILVLLTLKKVKEEVNVRVIICDSYSGARLQDNYVTFHKKELEKVSSELAQLVHSTLEHFKEGVKQVIGVPHFVSKTFIHDYDHLQTAYAYLLGNVLSSSPGVAVIEIEEAQSIRHESELAGDMEVARIVPFFVEGEFLVNNTMSEKELSVNMTIQISDNTGVIKQLECKDLAIDKVAEFIANDVTQQILKLSEASFAKILDKEKQFLALTKKADEFARLGAWKHSVGLREASLLLEPSSTTQRCKLISEYYKIRYKGRSVLCREHLEYLIYNHKINSSKALGLSKTVLHMLGIQARRDFLKKTYPKILKLTPSKPKIKLGYPERNEIEQRLKQLRSQKKLAWVEIDEIRKKFYQEAYELKQQTEIQNRHYGQWYSLLIEYSLKHWQKRARQGAAKEDLDFLLDIHENIVPDGMVPLNSFLDFLQRNAYPKFKKTTYIGAYPSKDFLDFAKALSESEKKLSQIYGQYALLLYDFKQVREHRTVPDGYKDRIESLSKKLSEAEFNLWDGGAVNYRVQKNLIAEHLKEIKRVTEVRIKQKGQKPKKPESELKPKLKPRAKFFHPKEAAESIIMGRLVFERIPLKVKDLSGNIKPMYKAEWPRLSGGWPNMRNLLKCNDSLDVMWSEGAVLVMKEKGLVEELLVTGDKFYVDDVKWDGQNFWIGLRGHGIWIVNLAGRVIAKITSDNGLPPSEKKIMLHPIEAGKIFAAGAFGPHRRVWCAIIKFENNETKVDVFYKAVYLTKAPKSDSKQPPDIVFTPSWIHEFNGKEKNDRIILLGRSSSVKKARDYPLEINLNKKTVGVFSHKLRTHNNKKAYTSNNGILFEGRDGSVDYFFSENSKFRGQKRKRQRIERGGANTWKYLLSYQDKIYCPGWVWWVIDPDTLEAESLISDSFDRPYNPMKFYGISAHYGIIGWNEGHNFYQVKFTDEEHLMNPVRSDYSFLNQDDYFSQFTGVNRLVPDEYSTIQKAVDVSQDGDTVIISPGTYTGRGNRDIFLFGKRLLIRSINPNDPNIVAATVIDCNGTKTNHHRVFYLQEHGASTPVIAGLTIANGYTKDSNSGSAIRSYQSNLTLLNCRLINNNGGYAAIYCYYGNIVVRDCEISGNNTHGISLSSVSADISGCVISNNVSGGIAIDIDSKAKFIDCRITGNSTNYKGGGVLADSGRNDLIFKNCIVNKNSAAKHGGGIYVSGGKLVIENSTIKDNQSGDNGGGICNRSDSGKITDCIISGNSAADLGGGVHRSKTISDCIITGNSSKEGGGLASCKNITNCIISDNTARSSGGGIYRPGTVRNCLIINNRADRYAGVSFFEELLNCTMVNNNSQKARNHRIGSKTEVQSIIKNCIIRENENSTLHFCKNIFFSNIDMSHEGIGNINKPALFVDPNNGDYRLMPNSPCIDAGDPNDDYSNESEPNGGRIDMGFYGNIDISIDSVSMP